MKPIEVLRLQQELVGARVVTTNQGTLVAVERGEVVAEATPEGDLTVYDWTATDALSLLTERLRGGAT